jgi:hypothetical protein
VPGDQRGRAVVPVGELALRAMVASSAVFRSPRGTSAGQWRAHDRARGGSSMGAEIRRFVRCRDGKFGLTVQTDAGRHGTTADSCRANRLASRETRAETLEPGVT